MLLKALVTAAVVAASVLLAGNSGWSFLPQDEKDAGKKMSQDDMAKVMAAAQPGEQHKRLAKLEGTWDQKIVNEAEGMSSSGTVTYKTILGGRFVVGETKATMKLPGPDGKANGSSKEHPYEAFQIIGYDNVAKKHTTTYLDSMSTGIFTAEGTADATGKIITYEGTMKDALTPQGRPFKVVVNCESDDKTTIQLWEAKGGGPLAKSCTITETRQK
jgi:Protein of unknown function (DUF1579)